MSPQILSIILLISSYFHSAFSQYLNETVIINLDLTIRTQSQLIISENDIQTIIESAFVSINTQWAINNIDNIQFLSSYNYYNSNNDYQYTALFNVYFQSANDYSTAMNRYTIFFYNSINTIMQEFEAEIISESSDNYTFDNVLINTFKIIKIDSNKPVSNQLLVSYTGDVTTTLTPTRLTHMPTVTPTLIPTEMPTKSPKTLHTTQESANTVYNSYTFSNEATYWILLILFLFVGCGIGCLCIYLTCIRLDMSQMFLHKRKDITDVRSNSVRNKKNNKSNDVNVAIEMGNKTKPKTDRKKRKKKERKRRQTSEEKQNESEMSESELRKKKERYINYGSEDDSDQSEAFKMPVKKTRQRVTTTTNTTREVSDDESIERITTQGYSDSDEKPKRKRNKNNRTGNVEPERFDTDGKRILTTKELMAQYKRKRQRGGDSVDLSYKVGTKRGTDTAGGRETPTSEGDEYEFDDSSHPHYKPHKLDKINESEKNRRHRKKKRKRTNSSVGYQKEKVRVRSKGRHKRSKTEIRRRRSRSQDRRPKTKEKKYVRPKSARHGKKRRQSARPKSARRRRKRRSKHKDSSSESSDEDKSSDTASVTPEPKNARRSDGNSSDYD